MPNSYVENAETGFDGESMRDWFTGSGCVLLKVLLWHVFGIKADLNGISIQPAKYIPFERMSLEMKLKGKPVRIICGKDISTIVEWL
jgi:cellobiose phosphorylase